MRFVTARVVLAMVIPVKSDEDDDVDAAADALTDALKKPDLLPEMPGASVRDLDVEITGEIEPDPT